jgi:hypothetical protein
MEKGFADLDAELTAHTTLPRDLEKEISALKKKVAAPRAPTRPRPARRR